MKTLHADGGIYLWMEQEQYALALRRARPIHMFLPDAERDRETQQDTISLQEVPTIQHWPAEGRHKLKP